MIRQRKKNSIVIEPPLAAWDFDLRGCPLDELEHCCFYEYALEIQAVREIVDSWRLNPQRFFQPGDEIGNLIGDRWFGLPFRVLAEYPDFPRKHWLEMDVPLRKRKIKELPPYSEIRFPTLPAKYDGPQSADFTRLKAAALMWRTINEEYERLRSQYFDAYSTQTLADWPTKLKYYLGEAGLSEWKVRLSKLSGTKLELQAGELLKHCKKVIEEDHRHKIELVPYVINWNLRPKELVEEFRQWAEANRVHDPRERGGGHPPKAVELLRALGAKRLLKFFRSHQKKLPLPYKSQTLHGGLHDFTIDRRKAAGRPAQALYRSRKNWRDAERISDYHLKV